MNVIEQSEEGGAQEPLVEGEAPAQREAKADPVEPGEESAEAGAAEEAGTTLPEEPKSERKRLEEQLEALKRKELELRRALLVADHPTLADGIRELEGRAFALGRAEAKIAQGLSKAEERRRDTLAKKLASLREKRAELDGQIGELEAEHGKLGTERLAAFAAERAEAMKQLLVTLGTHEPALRRAGIDASSVVPELARYLPEVEALAETLVSARDAGEVGRAAAEEAHDPRDAAERSPN
jgi:hypothetical protein